MPSDPSVGKDQALPKPANNVRSENTLEKRRPYSTASRASLWKPINAPIEPPVATVARYSQRLIDQTTGEAYSADEIGAIPVVAGILEDLSTTASDIQTPDGIMPSDVLIHDDFSGVAQTLVQGNTRSVVPGPGTATFTYAAGASYMSYEGDRAMMVAIPNSGAGPLLHYDAQTIAPGLTIMGRFIASYEEGMTWATRIGFSSTTAYALDRGAIQLYNAEAPYRDPIVAYATLAASTPDSTVRIYHRGILIPGKETAWAVKYKTAGKVEYWAQGGRLETLGCKVGSNNWFKIAEISRADLAGTVYPLINHQNNGATQWRDVKVLKNWSPSNEHGSHDFDITKLGIHIPSFGVDPVTGLLILAWNNGVAHIGSDVAIRYSTQLASGEWTADATLQAAFGSGSGQCIQSLSVVNGQLWLIYWKEPAALDGGVLYRKTITVNATTGAITLGTETLLGVSGSRNLCFTPIITLSNGRLMLFLHQTDFKSYFCFSDDHGITWSTPALVSSTANLIEPTALIESDGSVGVYMRSFDLAIKWSFYAKCSNPTAAVPTFATAAAVKSIPQPELVSITQGSRLQAINAENGKKYVIGNDNGGYRRAVTLWEVGDNAEVLDKHLVVDSGSLYNNGPIEQYPTVKDHNGRLHFAYSCQASAGGELSTAIQRHSWADAQPVDMTAGGSGFRSEELIGNHRQPNSFRNLAFAVGPVMNCLLGDRWELTLTASTATVGIPLNPMPWQELRLAVIQGGSGSYTLAFNAIFEMNGTTPTLRTAVNASNMFVFCYNPATSKWVLQSFN